VDTYRLLAQLLKALGRTGWANVELFPAAKKAPQSPADGPGGQRPSEPSADAAAGRNWGAAGRPRRIRRRPDEALARRPGAAFW
jgi:hypothetical protein